MGFLKNKDGIEAYIRYLWYANSLLVGNLSKYSTPVATLSSTPNSASLESSYFLINSTNMASPSFSFVQTNYVLDDGGTKFNDSRNNLSLQTFFVMNEIDGSGGNGGSGLMYYGSSSSSLGSSSFLVMVIVLTKWRVWGRWSSYSVLLEMIEIGSNQSYQTPIGQSVQVRIVYKQRSTRDVGFYTESTLKRSTNESQTDCHAGNPCELNCDPTDMITPPMIS
ncbi:hypothetical protein Tco_0527926 [Tanacetum coccineum]